MTKPAAAACFQCQKTYKKSLTHDKSDFGHAQCSSTLFQGLLRDLLPQQLQSKLQQCTPLLQYCKQCKSRLANVSSILDRICRLQLILERKRNICSGKLLKEPNVRRRRLPLLPRTNGENDVVDVEEEHHLQQLRAEIVTQLKWSNAGAGPRSRSAAVVSGNSDNNVYFGQPIISAQSRPQPHNNGDGLLGQIRGLSAKKVWEAYETRGREALDERHEDEDDQMESDEVELVEIDDAVGDDPDHDEEAQCSPSPPELEPPPAKKAKLAKKRTPKKKPKPKIPKEKTKKKKTTKIVTEQEQEEEKNSKDQAIRPPSKLSLNKVQKKPHPHPYSCSFCPNKFPTERSLLRHLSRKHGEAGEGAKARKMMKKKKKKAVVGKIPQSQSSQCRQRKARHRAAKSIAIANMAAAAQRAQGRTSVTSNGPSRQQRFCFSCRACSSETFSNLDELRAHEKNAHCGVIMGRICGPVTAIPTPTLTL